GESIFSNTTEAINLYGKSRFGEMVDGKVKYSLAEALFLQEQGKLDIYEKNKKVSQKKFLEKLKKLDPKIETKYIVFEDLRKRGYIVKTALKFGAEFRVYEKGKFPGEEHARWILYPVKETDILTWHDFSAKNRVAHSTRKKLLIAVVDEENDVTYYEVAWIRP
ncbi:MAG: tRNA-intron lyase, partial [Candidatus Pacearchaeota archaeon]